MGQRSYWVYIMTNAHHTVLYTGVTNDLARRVWEHKHGVGNGFAERYNTDRLVYFEHGLNPRQAIEREKQIKGGSRKAKMDLIGGFNPEWKDLSSELG